jgi:hypothetical protein
MPASSPSTARDRWSDLSVVAEYLLDPDVAPRLTQLICAGPGGDPFLAVTALSGVEQTSLIRHADGEARVLREDVEWLVDTASGPIAIGGGGEVLGVDPVTGVLREAADPMGDVDGQLVAVVPSPDGSRLAVGAVDWKVTLQVGKAFIVDLQAGTFIGILAPCEVYPQ